MENKQAENYIKQSKDWRVRLDAVLQEMKKQQEAEAGQRHASGRNLALSITHLEDAIMRQGMRCKDIAETNPEVAGQKPYPEGYNPANAKVEPTADGLKM